MAEEGQGQERTEQATPRRREKARKDGQSPLSQEVAVAMSMLLLTALIAWAFPVLAAKLVAMFRTQLAIDDSVRMFDSVTAVTAVRRLHIACLRIAGPVTFAAMVLGLLVTVAQVGMQFNSELLTLKWNRLDPSNWFKRMFSVELPVNLLKSMFKGLGIVVIAMFALRHEPDRLFLLAYVPATGLATEMGDVSLGVIARVSAALAVVAGVDLLWTRHRFEERIKMSRQELKDEVKETDGSPEMRARRKQVMRERLSGQSLESQVKDATVVAVNPTHYSVALRYWQGQDAAPVVLAKGVDHKAQRIRELAKKHGIPIIEDKPLTRTLYKAVKEGQQVPLDLFHAVANLLALVYRMRGEAGGRR